MRIGLVGINNPDWVSLSLYYLYANILPIVDPNNIEIIEYSLKLEPEKIIKDLKQRNLDIICFSMYLWNEIKLKYIISKIKNQKKEPIVYAGGPSVNSPEKMLQNNPSIDILIKGEGEITLKKLLQKKKLNNILGISYRIKNKIIHNSERPVLKRLDDLNSPFKKELNFPFQKKFMYSSSRGCKYNCIYCKECSNGHFRSFSLNRINDDLKNIVENSPNKSVSFSDSIFNRNNDFLKEILKIKNKLPDFDLFVEIDANTLDEEGINLLKLLKVRGIETGPQTTSKKCLNTIKRTLNKENFKNNIKKLEKVDIKVTCDLILGLPGDNVNSFKESLNYLIHEVNPNHICVLNLNVLPGTELYKNTKKWDLKYNPLPPFNIISNKTFSQKDIKKAEEHVETLSKKYANIDLIKG